MLCAMAVSTYFTEELLDSRLGLFFLSVSSLRGTTFPGPIYIVDDGSTVDDHLVFVRSLQDPRFKIVVRSSNGGVSRAKNTCLRLLQESGAKFLFLCDDDVGYLDTVWHAPFITAMSVSGVGHLSPWERWYWEGGDGEPAEGFLPRRRVGEWGHGFGGPFMDEVSPALEWFEKCSGYMLAFTAEVLHDIGFFEVYTHPSGNEHRHWSDKFAWKLCGRVGSFDLKNSNDLVCNLDVNSSRSSLPAEFNSVWVEKNTEDMKALGLESRAECVEY